MSPVVWLKPEVVNQITRLFKEARYSSAYDVNINHTDTIHYDCKKWFITVAGVNRTEGYKPSLSVN